MRKKYTFYGLIAIVFSLVLWSSCAKNPVTGKKELMLMTEKQEIALGQQSDPSIVATYGLYQDDKIQAFINSKGQEMAKLSHRPDLNYEFKIMDSPVINAFAVPGGYVYFTRGIMAHFNNEAEFAGVLGHEIGHITARHSAKQQSKATLAQVGLMVGMIASEKIRQFGNMANTGVSLLFLKFGRDNESESDRLGVEYSTKIGYDSKHMANFFKTLNRMREGSEGGDIPTFMSTHPDPLDRFAKVHQHTDHWQQQVPRKNRMVNRNEYLRMIDGLVYGEDPRQGYFEANMFYQPQMKFKFITPQGWQKVNTPMQVQMADPGGKAAMYLRLAPEKTKQEAANNLVEQNQLKVIESKEFTVNGLPALGFVADQVNAQDPNATIRILTYLIEYNGLIYTFHGLSLVSDFDTYLTFFKQTMDSFDVLRDQNKINVYPERIKVITVSGTQTLQKVLASNQIANDRHREFAILNGMELTQSVQSGTLIKVVDKKPK